MQLFVIVFALPKNQKNSSTNGHSKLLYTAKVFVNFEKPQFKTSQTKNSKTDKNDLKKWHQFGLRIPKSTFLH